jgi:branched-chain amino acid transport system substrate-binding protein
VFASRKTAAALVCVAVAALVAAGVSSASGGRARAAAGAPITLFVESTENSQIINQPDVRYGVNAAVKAINAAGGVRGRKLTTSYCNDEFVTAKLVACAQKGVASKAVAVVGIQHSDANVSVYQQGGLPLIGPNGDAGDLKNPIQFPLTGGATIGYAALPVMLKRAGVKKVAIMSYNIPAERSLDAIILTAIKRAGLESAGVVNFPPQGTTDFSPYAQKVKSSGADGVIFVTNISIMAANMRALRSLGSNAVFANTSTTVGDAEAASLGSLANGMVIASDLPPNSAAKSVPAVARYLKETKAAGVPTQWTRGVGLNAWLSVYAVKQLMEGIKGPITRASVLKALHAAKGKRALRVLDLVTWKPGASGGDPKFPRLTNTSVWYAKVKGGKIVLAAPKPVSVFAK